MWGSAVYRSTCQLDSVLREFAQIRTDFRFADILSTTEQRGLAPTAAARLAKR